MKKEVGSIFPCVPQVFARFISDQQYKQSVANSSPSSEKEVGNGRFE